MIVPQFIRFYGYTASQTLDEYGKVFFALVNSMYMLRAVEMMDGITTASVPNASEGQARNIMDKLHRSSQGAHGILKEVKVIKDAK